jgi:Cdc6-like AAA superfamily ATPase
MDPQVAAMEPMTPGADSDAIAGCNRAPDAVSPGNARNNLGRTFDSQVPSGKTTDSTKNSEPSHRVNDEAAVTEFDKYNAASIRAGDEPNATQEFIPPSSAEVAAQVVLSGKTVEEKLQSCLDAMKVGYDDELVVGESLSAALGKVGCFMKEVVDSRGLRKNAFLHICGAPGIGKTLGVRACEKKMGQYWNDEKSRSIDKAHLEAPKYIFLKGSEFQNLTKAQAMQKTFEHSGVNAKQLRRPSDLEKSSKSAVILILDEIDMLISRPGTEEYLRTLVGYAADENMRLGLIGISNSIENDGLNDVGFVSLIHLLQHRPFMCH